VTLAEIIAVELDEPASVTVIIEKLVDQVNTTVFASTRAR
jgi:hypothetical protein